MVRVILPLVLAAAVAAGACNQDAFPTKPEGRPEAGPPPPVLCQDSLWKSNSDPLMAAANAWTSSVPAWQIKNKNSFTLHITRQTFSSGGNVLAVAGSRAISVTLLAGSTIDFEPDSFETGDPGSGTLGLALSTTECGTITFSNYGVTIN